MIKAFAFDLINTIFDVTNVPEHFRRDYTNHIRNEKEFRPLQFGEEWEKCVPFPDVDEGLSRLVQCGIFCFTFSNMPHPLQMKLIQRDVLLFDFAIDVESFGVHKPNPKAYQRLPDEIRSLTKHKIHKDEICVVTANEFFGDLEGARNAGMLSQLIRGNSGVKNLVQLAEMMERARNV